MLTPGIKKQIDAMDYESMLRKWRFSVSGDPMFQGEVGKYFQEVMFKKRDALPDHERVQASKNVGWG
ncbi:MAG: hypothetical protein PHT07_14855 [Paludibacter sp.]|nr:hypothetical protein [Paludibacter sp.]